MTELQEKVKQLLNNGDIDLVIGWEAGSLPLVSTPVFIQDAKQAEKLIFDPTCRNNLSTFLTKDRRRLGKEYKKIGIIAKGCDARSLVLYVAEKQVKRDQIVIIGVPCQGIIETRKVMEKTQGREVLDKQINDDQITLKGRNFEFTIPIKEVLRDCCLSCRFPDAPVYDHFVGVHRGEQEIEDEFKDIEEFEKEPAAERWEIIKEEYSKCIRCYACRNACPACYCNECFVDHNDPQWIGKTPEVTDNIIFHLIRNLHLAGRCVDCGACASACPVHLDLRPFNKKVEKEVKERFGYIAGLDIDEKPAMATHKEDEKQDFIMG